MYTPQQVQQLFRQGKLEEAAALCAILLRQSPEDVRLHGLAGMIAARMGRMEEAVDHYRAALALQPDNASLHDHLGIVLGRQGALEEAVTHFRRALELDPGRAATCNNLGLAYKELGDAEQAEACYRKALEIAPDFAEAHNNLGVLQSGRGRLGEAEACFREALALQPDYLNARVNLAVSLQAQGRIDEADQCFRAALALQPGNGELHSKLLFNLNYDATIEAQTMFEAHREWDRRHGGEAMSASSFPNDRDPQRRLRIGYVSADFRKHSVAFFLESLLAHHDREAVEVYCYSDVIREDEVTRRLRALVPHWRRTCGVDDAELALRIRRDAIDILVDLAGHTAGNRMAVFARRAAPVQISWLGYPNTTGLAAMDYRITDFIADPPGAEQWHSEQLLRLRGGFLCYQGETGHPGRGPAAVAEHVVFGSFNNLSKFSDQVLNLWAEILRRVPNARLLLKNRALEDPACRDRLIGRFFAHGVEAERLELVGWTATPEDHLHLYERVDIALDTAPYNGTTTTCEALWMGVPVITLCGERHASRVGASLLHRIGLDELVAADAAGYVSLAVDLAGDPMRRSELHTGLRRRMLSSPLCDGKAFAREMESAYRRVWGEWCGGRAED